jgi:spermidine/putrescine transport system permease protein
VIPGVLLGSALLVSSRETGVALGLSATAIVHVMLLVSEITLITYARLTGIDSHLVEAARDLGASPSRALRSVTLPLLLPAIVGAALFAAAYSLDEIFVTSFTLGSENTLPVWLFGQARIGFTPGINAVGVMLLFGTLLAFTLAVLIGRRSVLSTGGEAQ